MKTITYFIEGKKERIKVKVCDTPLKKFSGLMFRRNSPPLLLKAHTLVHALTSRGLARIIHE